MIEILKSAELSKRIALSKERLSSKEYAYPGIFNNKSDWSSWILVKCSIVVFITPNVSFTELKSIFVIILSKFWGGNS